MGLKFVKRCSGMARRADCAPGKRLRAPQRGRRSDHAIGGTGGLLGHWGALILPLGTYEASDSVGLCVASESVPAKCNWEALQTAHVVASGVGAASLDSLRAPCGITS